VREFLGSEELGKVRPIPTLLIDLELQRLTFELNSWAKQKYRATIDTNDQPLFISSAKHVLGDVATGEQLIENEEAQVAFLVSLCPNLVQLYFENPTTPTETPRFVLDHMM
jgi:hypothetical protein